MTVHIAKHVFFDVHLVEYLTRFFKDPVVLSIVALFFSIIALHFTVIILPKLLVFMKVLSG